MSTPQHPRSIPGTRVYRVFATALPALAVVLLSPLAIAHHGWAWAEDAQSTLTGKVQSVSMAAPHPTLQVTAADGAVWQIDLGNPSQTERSGFTAQSAKTGDAITVLGNRNRDKARTHMKAVRVTIAGKSYDLYPERITPQ
jgi:phage-related tail fiber protein